MSENNFHCTSQWLCVFLMFWYRSEYVFDNFGIATDDVKKLFEPESAVLNIILGPVCFIIGIKLFVILRAVLCKIPENMEEEEVQER